MAAAARARGTIRDALRSRDLRLLLGGLAISKAGDWLYVVGLQVFVFDRTHSAGWVAATTVLRLVPAGLLAPLGGALADRYERRRVMIASDLARAAVMFALAAVAWRGGPPVAALALAFAAATAGSPYLPAAGAMTPDVVPESELAAANSALSLVDNIAIVAGPALGGLLLILGSPAAAFAFNGLSFGASAVAVGLMRTRSRAVAVGGADMAAQLLEGLRAVVTSRGTAVICGFGAATSLLYGLETVLLLLVAQRQLGVGAAGYGYLLAGLGVGGVAASAIMGRLAEYERPALLLTAGIAGMGLPLAALAFAPSLAVALPLLALQGAANIVVDVTAFTLLQRSVPEAMLARVFGFLELTIIGSILLGAVAAPLLLRAGLAPALLLSGLVVPAVALICLPLTKDVSLAALRGFQQARARYELLRRLSLFEGTPRPALELLARGAEIDQEPAGAVIVREGDPAHDLYIVDEGSLDVVTARDGREVPLAKLGAGDYFGEIGILRGVPRTATVRAESAVKLLKIEAGEFLAAVNSSPSLSGILADGMAARLARGGAAGRRRARR